MIFYSTLFEDENLLYSEKSLDIQETDTEKFKSTCQIATITEAEHKFTISNF